MGLKSMIGICAAGLVLAVGSAQAGMQITEWQYNGSEYIEFTNLGSTTTDMAGWSFDDSSRTPGSVDLSAFGVVAANESVLLAEVTAAEFKTLWNLGAGVKVIGSNSNNLGRADELNLYDNLGALVDRLTYDDQTIPPPSGGSIRAQNISGNPINAAAIGANDVTKWVFSAVGDRYGSYQSTPPGGPFIGNPGVNTVPEPTTLVAIALGAVLAAVGFRRNR